MITITRNLARQLRLLAKRGFGWSGKHPREIFQCEIKNGRLRLDAVTDSVSLTYCEETTQSDERLMFPCAALALCEGKSHELVTFEFPDDKHIRVAWQDGNIPQIRDLDAPSDPSIRISAPIEIESDNWSTQPPHFLQILKDAVATTDQSPSRYALNCLQLRGKTGEIDATDGRQILVQSGMSFNWQEDLLVQGSSIFSCATLSANQSILLAKTDTHVLFRIGRWTIGLKIQTDVRFPKLAPLLGSRGSAESRIDFSKADRQFLLDTIPKLPRDLDQHQAVTVELNGKIAIRAKSEQQPTATELILTSSQRLGPDIRINTNRFYLQRALEMGFQAMTIYGTNVPVQCHDRNRTFLWAVLSPEHALKSVAGDVSIESSSCAAQVKMSRSIERISVDAVKSENPQQTSNLPQTHMTKNNNMSGYGKTDNSNTTDEVGDPNLSPLEAATIVRDGLRNMLQYSNSLIGILKRHKKQSRLVKTTLDSLKQLQSVA